MSKIPLVYILIMNCNGKEYLKKCISSVINQSYRNLKIVFIDNHSSDGSVEFVKSNFKKFKKSGKLQIIANKKNYGYAEGNNIGFRHALKNEKTKYIAVLNNDTVVENNWLNEMVISAEADKNIGSCACKTIVYDNRSILETAGIIIYKNCSGAGRGLGESVKKYSKKDEVFGAYGAAALYRREMLEDIKIGKDYFDSDYFIYQEEFDLSWRSLIRGWKCIFVPNAKVYHICSAFGRTMPNRVKYLLERNRIWTIIKNLQRGLFFYCLPHIIIYEFATIPFYMKKRQLGIVIRARFDSLKSIGKFLVKRRYIQKNVKISPCEMKRYMKNKNYW